MADSYFEDRDPTIQMHRKHDSSKAKCFWKDCTNRIYPDQMFCSKSCQNKSFSYDGWSRMHMLALNFWNPDPAYMAASLPDGGLWYTRMNPIIAKLRTHGTIWNESWATIFSRYGVKRAVPPRPRLPTVDDIALQGLTRGAITASGMNSWHQRHEPYLNQWTPHRAKKLPGVL